MRTNIYRALRILRIFNCINGFQRKTGFSIIKVTWRGLIYLISLRELKQVFLSSLAKEYEIKNKNMRIHIITAVEKNEF